MDRDNYSGPWGGDTALEEVEKQQLFEAKAQWANRQDLCAAAELPADFFSDLEMGELYLFHDADPACPAESSLWGLFRGCSGAVCRLESSSIDLERFRIGGELHPAYRYHRLATRAELRDYCYLLGCYESRGHLFCAIRPE